MSYNGGIPPATRRPVHSISSRPVTRPKSCITTNDNHRRDYPPISPAMDTLAVSRAHRDIASSFFFFSFFLYQTARFRARKTATHQQSVILPVKDNPPIYHVLLQYCLSLSCCVYFSTLDYSTDYWIWHSTAQSDRYFSFHASIYVRQ